MNNNTDALMFDYLLQMGAMQPEQQDLRRKQAMIDALRTSAMTSPQGQMVGKHYVAPSLMQYAAQLGQGYMAGNAQGMQDEAMRDINRRQRTELENLRRRTTALPVEFYSADLGQNY